MRKKIFTNFRAKFGHLILTRATDMKSMDLNEQHLPLTLFFNDMLNTKKPTKLIHFLQVLLNISRKTKQSTILCLTILFVGVRILSSTSLELDMTHVNVEKSLLR